MIEHGRRWFFDPGQGPLWDLGVYGAALLASWFGEPDGIGALARDCRAELTSPCGDDRVTVDFRAYRVVLTWPRVTARLDIGFDSAAPDPYNVVARVGGTTARASLWDYGLPLRYDRRPADIGPAATVETRKYVHGLTTACRFWTDPEALSTHQAEVGRTLTLLNRIEEAGRSVAVIR